jgi:hypothetical protein
LAAVASEACFARVLRAKLSPMTTHAMGPHVPAKDAMNMHAATIMTTPAVELFSGSIDTPTAAKMHSQAVCQRAPRKSGHRRPNFSTTYRP